MKKIFNTAPLGSFLKLQITWPYGREQGLLPVSSIGIIQRYVTELTAAEASVMSSQPPVLNIPPGKYIFIGGAIENNGQSVSLELGVGDIVISDENNFILAKQAAGNAIDPSMTQALSPYYSNPVNEPSGKYSLIVDADTPNPLDGPVKITLLVVPI